MRGNSGSQAEKQTFHILPVQLQLKMSKKKPKTIFEYQNNEWLFRYPTYITDMLVSNCKFSSLVFRNLKVLSEHSGYVDQNLMPSFNYSDASSVGLEDYRAWFKQHGGNISGNLTDCDLEKEMQKVKRF